MAIKSYLRSRPQFFYIHKITPDIKHVVHVCGIPQGYILGPFFFILYINDVTEVPDTLYTILSADDPTLEGKNESKLINSVITELQKLSFWFKDNKLTIPSVSILHFIVLEIK